MSKPKSPDDIRQLAERIPQLARNRIWCRTCGAMQKVDSAAALSGGWPKCCGHTMTIDSPEEQQALARKTK